MFSGEPAGYSEHESLCRLSDIGGAVIGFIRTCLEEEVSASSDIVGSTKMALQKGLSSGQGQAMEEITQE